MKYDETVRGMNPATKSALESIVEDYKSRIVDKLLEESMARNRSLDQISIKDVLESENSLESERELKQNQKLKQRLSVLYYVATIAFAFSVSLYMLPFLETRSEIASMVADFSQLAITIALGLVLVLILVVIREFRQKVKPMPEEEIRWSIVRLWSEIEKTANDKIAAQSEVSVVTPSRIVQWISEKGDIPKAYQDALRTILSIRNETVHGLENKVRSLQELRKIEAAASELVALLSKRTT